MVLPLLNLQLSFFLLSLKRVESVIMNKPIFNLMRSLKFCCVQFIINSLVVHVSANAYNCCMVQTPHLSHLQQVLDIACVTAVFYGHLQPLIW